jgi:hypothetical protein
MNETTIITLISILLTVLFGGGGLIGYITYRENKRQNARHTREAATTEELARRREIASALIVNTRRLRNLLLDLQPKHDSLVVRFVQLDPIGYTTRRKIRAQLNAIIDIRSRLVLEPGAQRLDQAMAEFLQAWDAYGTTLEKLLRTITKKGDPQELARLKSEMNVKLEAIETMAQQFASPPSPTRSSKVQRLLNVPRFWFRRKTPGARASWESPDKKNGQKAWAANAAHFKK